MRSVFLLRSSNLFLGPWISWYACSNALKEEDLAATVWSWLCVLDARGQRQAVATIDFDVITPGVTARVSCEEDPTIKRYEKNTKTSFEAGQKLRSCVGEGKDSDSPSPGFRWQQDATTE